MATDIDKHQKWWKQGLSQAFDDPGTTETTFDINEDRLIIFSDHHRGAKDGADDFWRCECAVTSRSATTSKLGTGSSSWATSKSSGRTSSTR